MAKKNICPLRSYLTDKQESETVTIEKTDRRIWVGWNSGYIKRTVWVLRESDSIETQFVEINGFLLELDGRTSRFADVWKEV